MIKKSIFHHCLNGDVINKTRIFKSKTSKHINSLKIRKYYVLTNIVYSLSQVLLVTNIDSLLVV
jgi:hypothetical protein